MKSILSADFSSPAGCIRPLHGVNSGPMTKVFTYDARPCFSEIGIPYARLHDVEYPYGSGEFVDIPCIFRDFDADENDPENYSFGLTDEYLTRCIEVGAEPFFRLGVSIEHAPVKRHIYPPRDFAKWARICEHVIRHYTEGWADGFNWQITYWELWNEPDGANMWLGTPEQYYELYVTTARRLKAEFPHIKVGGPALCSAYNAFAVGFMRYLNKEAERTGERVPLDFYSWHIYSSNVEAIIEQARSADRLLREYGYNETESILDEWNYMQSWDKRGQAESYLRMKGHIGAAHHAAVLCALQQSTSVAVGCYFEADVVKEFCGIFETTEMSIGTAGKATVELIKGGYAFKAFGELFRLGNAVRVEGCGDGIYACAATGENRQGLLAVNYSDESGELTLSLRGLSRGRVIAFVTDEHRTDERLMSLSIPTDGILELSLPMKPFGFLRLSVTGDSK